MIDTLVGDWQSIGWVVLKAVLMYLTALVGLRVSERRTLAQWTIIDFATAVAVGAIIGRTAIARGQSYIIGAAALLALIAIHKVAASVRRVTPASKLFDHRIRVLVVDGVIREDQLRKCGLTETDVEAHVRRHGCFAMADIAYVLYETKGDITIVPKGSETAPLIQAALRDAVDVDDLSSG